MVERNETIKDIYGKDVKVGDEVVLLYYCNPRNRQNKNTLPPPRMCEIIAERSCL